MAPGWLGKATAEFVGTFGVVFFGAGSVVVDAYLGPDGYGLVGIAAVHAVAFAIAITSAMRISGGHVNPAVTVAAFLTRKISARLAGVYVVAQLAGGVLGAAFVRSLLPVAAGGTTSYGATLVAGGVGALTAVTLEILLAFFLVFTVFATILRDDPPPVGGAVVGLTLFVGMMIGAPFTDAAMNPARALGPAIVSGEWAMHWVYWVGPVLGGALAGGVWDGLVEPARSAGSETE